MGTTNRTPRLGAALAAAALVAAACAPGEGGGDTLRLATGSTGGTYYPLGAAIAGVWSSSEEVGKQVSTRSSGASEENMRLLDRGDIELGLSVNGTAMDAANSTGVFADDPLDNPDKIVMLGNIYAEVLQVVARKDAGVASIADLSGKRVAIGPPGGATVVLSPRIMEAYGVDVSTVNTTSDTFGDATSKLRDGGVDAAFAILDIPHGGTEELARTTDIVILNVDGEPAEQIMADDPTMSPMTIPGGTYHNLESDVTTLTQWATLYATSDLDADVAYGLVKVLYEKNEDIAAAHATGAQIQLDTALTGFGDVPLHDGAKRYYDERGVSTE